MRTVLSLKAPSYRGGGDGGGPDGSQPTFFYQLRRYINGELNDWVRARVGFLLPDHVAREDKSYDADDGIWGSEFYPKANRKEVEQLLKNSPNYDSFNDEDAYDAAGQAHFAQLKALGYFAWSISFRRFDVGQPEDDVFARHGLRSNFAEAARLLAGKSDPDPIVVPVTITKA